MTNLSYNTVDLGFIRTVSLDTVEVYDQTSGKDLIYLKHTVSVEAALSFTGKNPIVLPGQPGDTPATTWAQVKHLLSIPRKDFSYKVGGVEVLGIIGADCAGGPMTEGPSVVAVTDNTWIYTFKVILCVNDCGDQPRSKWSSLKWTMEHNIDEKNRAVITTSGQLVVNFDLVKDKIDSLRGLVVPPLPPNFSRVSKYQLQADGMALGFTFVDTEWYIAPPPDATKMSGKFTYSFSKGGGKAYGTVQLRLEGRKEVPKRRLIATAISIAFDRLRRARTKNDPGKIFLLEGNFTEYLEENIVECQLTALLTPAIESGGAMMYGGNNVPGPNGGQPWLADLGPANKAQRERDAATAAVQAKNGVPIGLLPLGLEQFGAPLLGCGRPGDTSAGIAPDLYGVMPNFRMIAATFQDPCLDAALNVLKMRTNQAAGMKGVITPRLYSNPPSPSPPTPPASIVILNNLPPLIPIALAGYDDPYSGVYETYIVECEYDIEKFNCLLPATVAGLPAAEVRLANDLVMLDVSWTATKWGLPPTIPQDTPVTSNAVLLKKSFYPDQMEIGPDGLTPIYSISGCYRYAFKDATLVQVQTPLVPWLGAYPRANIMSTPTDNRVVPL